jgi:hypothetical protein
LFTCSRFVSAVRAHRRWHHRGFPPCRATRHRRCPTARPGALDRSLVSSSSSWCHPRSKPSSLARDRRSSPERHRSPPASRRRRTCACPGPSDRDPTARVGFDPGPCGSTRTAAPAGHRHRRTAIQRIGSVPRLSNPPGLGGFARKPSPSFKFTTRSFHRIGFLANRSCFLRFSPGSLVFFSD